MAELKKIDTQVFRKKQGLKNGSLLITHRDYNKHQSAYLIVEIEDGYVLINMANYRISEQAKTLDELVDQFLKNRQRDSGRNPITDIFFTNKYGIHINETFGWKKVDHCHDA